MSERVPAIKLLLMPKDTNAHGTIFGGVILSHIVTKAMREVEFHEPVFVGDVVNFYTETVRVGRTSVTVKVSVVAERWAESSRSTYRRGEQVTVTEAEVVLVSVDNRGRPTPIHPDPVQA